MKRTTKVPSTRPAGVAPIRWPFSPDHLSSEKRIEAWNKSNSALPIPGDQEFVLERRKRDG